ncbi:MAG: hypothetical protein R3A13_07815 [Bdellovibrionota bacterium]
MTLIAYVPLLAAPLALATTFVSSEETAVLVKPPPNKLLKDLSEDCRVVSLVFNSPRVVFVSSSREILVLLGSILVARSASEVASIKASRVDS